jgi:hypothetical protein
MGTFGADANGEVTSDMNHKGESTKAAPRDGTLRSSEEVGESRRSEGVCAVKRHRLGQPARGGAWRMKQNRFVFTMGSLGSLFKVKSNQGAAGLTIRDMSKAGR